MSLINCPECGKEMSDQAKSCPNCGYKNKQSNGTVALVITNIISVLFLIINMIIPFILLILRFYFMNRIVTDDNGTRIFFSLARLINVNTIMLSIMSLLLIFFLVKKRTKFASIGVIVSSIVNLICYLNQIIFTIIDVVGWKVSFVRFCIYSIIPCILLASIIIFILFMNTKKKMNGILLASIWIASQLIVAVFCFIIYFIAISVDVPHFAEDFIKEISRLSVPTFNNPFAYSIFFIGPLTSFMNIILLIANIPLIVVNKLQNKEKKS